MFFYAVTFILCTSIITTDHVYTCDSEGSGYFKFLSATKGRAIQDQTITIPGKCFESLVISTKKVANGYNIHVDASKHKSDTCVEFLTFSSGKTAKTLFIVLEGKYDKLFETELFSDAEKLFVQKKGFYVLRSCDDFKNIFYNVFTTLKMFVGGMGLNPYIPIFGSKILEYQLKANIDFSKKFTGFEWKLRQNPKKVILDKKNIKSGDYISIIRFDGLDNIIHWGTGSRSGHSAMCIWHEGELYVVESQNALYWPSNDIQKRKWDSWVQWADNADFNVALIPLSDEARAKFDEKKAWEAFEKLEGHPYGFSNFIFGWIDTETLNTPDVLDLVFLSLILQLAEKVIPDQIKLIFYDAWNQRLGTKGLNIGGIWEELYKRDLSLAQLSAQVEIDGWEYPTGPNYVCSAFVVHLYKAAGLFGDLSINAPEFTPKDLYELNFYDVTGNKVPSECKDSAPRGYCQIMGKVDMDLGKINFVKPYSNMAERCPTVPPLYERQEGC